MRKTIDLGCNMRVCSRIEKSISPTIVATDKKGYEVENTPFGVGKGKYKKAKDCLR